MTSRTLITQDANLKASLLQRGDMLSAVALRDLKRYYALLSQCLIKISFTEGQAYLLCDALKDYWLENNYGLENSSEQIEAIWQRVAQAVEQDRLNQKWGVNSETINRKLQAFDSLQTLALVDAVEQYWVREKSHPNESPQTRLLRVDLIKCCDFAL